MSEQSRYCRQMNLLGSDGQQALADIKILCIGAGGLGALVSSYLAAAGVGAISLVDNDTIELSNLTRQITYKEKDCCQSKALIQAEFLNNLNSNCIINSYNQQFTQHNAEELINAHDLILDCTDNFSTRFLISDVCSAKNKPLISAAVDGFNGQVIVILPDVCYRCLFPQTNESSRSCFNGDVIGTAVGIISLNQANEALKLITGINYRSKLIQIDCLENTQNCFSLAPDPDCINHHQDFSDYSGIEYLDINKVMELNAKQQVKVIDLRNKLHLKTGQLVSGSIDINSSQITDVINLIDKNTAVVVICNYGFKSRLSASKLFTYGYKVYYSSVVRQPFR